MRCDITHIWMWNWQTLLLSNVFLSASSPSPALVWYLTSASVLSIHLSVCPSVWPLSVCLSPLCLSICLFCRAPAPRDERKEPLALACEHHHRCDWRHRHCCPGDHNSFAEQAPSPKIQGRMQNKNKKKNFSSLCLKYRLLQLKLIVASRILLHCRTLGCTSVLMSVGHLGGKHFLLMFAAHHGWTPRVISPCFYSDTKKIWKNTLLAAAFINYLQACSYAQWRRTAYSSEFIATREQ